MKSFRAVPYESAIHSLLYYRRRVNAIRYPAIFPYKYGILNGGEGRGEHELSLALSYIKLRWPCDVAGQKCLKYVISLHRSRAIRNRRIVFYAGKTAKSARNRGDRRRLSEVMCIIRRRTGRTRGYGVCPAEGVPTRETYIRRRVPRARRRYSQCPLTIRPRYVTAS